MKTFLTNRMFNLCFLLAFGLAFWPSAVRAQTPISCGETISSNIVAVGHIDEYTYSGTAGEVVSFVFDWVATSCGNVGEMDIYYPGANLAGPPSTNLTANCDGSQVKLTLPGTGTYTLLVHVQGNDGTAIWYTLSVQSISTGGCNPTPIACGQTLSSNITAEGESDPYHFQGTAGEVVSFVFDWVATSCGNAGEMDIYYPGATTPATNLTANCNGSQVKLTLPSTGTYMLLVHEQGYYGTAIWYTLSVQSISTGGCNPTPIACGQTLSSNITAEGESDPYHFQGTAGEVVSFVFDWVATSCGNAGEMDIYYPGATTPATNLTADCDGSQVELTLPSTGTYMLLVHEQGYYGTAIWYTLSVQSISTGGCNPTPIACGQTLSSSITAEGESDPYQFESNPGEVVSFVFDWTATSCGNAGEMDIYYPGATTPATNLISNCSGALATLTLPTCGTYMFLVHQQGYYGTGNYSITPNCLAGTCTHTTSTTSSPLNGGTTSGGGVVVCCFPVTVCAEPAPCYNFVNWTLGTNVLSTSLCYSFVAASNSTLTANFAPTAGTKNQICNFQVVGTNAAISGQSVMGDNYQLQSRTSMTTGNWSNVAGVVLSNSPGGLIILTNFGGAVAPQKFYRLDVTP